MFLVLIYVRAESTPGPYGVRKDSFTDKSQWPHRETRYTWLRPWIMPSTVELIDVCQASVTLFIPHNLLFRFHLILDSEWCSLFPTPSFTALDSFCISLNSNKMHLNHWIINTRCAIHSEVEFLLVLFRLYAEEFNMLDLVGALCYSQNTDTVRHLSEIWRPHIDDVR
jgi:hypothetical protein